MSEKPSAHRKGVHEASPAGHAAVHRCPPSIPNGLAAELVLHVVGVVRICCRVFPERDRMDIAQDALVALVERVHEGRPVQEPRSWLGAVVCERPAMRCRGRRRDRGTLSLSSWPRNSEPGASAHESACRAGPWADVERLLADMWHPYPEEDKAELRTFAAGDTRHKIARDRREKVRGVGEHDALPPVLRRDLDAVHLLGRSAEGGAS